jgi:hypothetical protein
MSPATLPGEQSGTRLQPMLRLEGRHGGHQLQGGADGALGVVLVGGRGAPDRHHGIADELLDGPAVTLHDLSGRLEIPAEHLAGLLRVASLGQRGEPDEVVEENGDQATLGSGGRRAITRGGRRIARLGWRGSSAASQASDQLSAAFAAELRAGRVGRPAGGAADGQPGAAFAAELAIRLVLGAARGTSQQWSAPGWVVFGRKSAMRAANCEGRAPRLQPRP